MRALVWISEATWQGCVDRARELLPDRAEVTLLHVADGEVEHLAGHPGPERFGRHRPPPPEPRIRALAESEAQELLAAAADRFGRAASTSARRGRAEREVLAAAGELEIEVLVLAREGERKLGPPSLGRRARFVVDHACCPVLLVWAGEPPPVDSIHWPPHLR
ncbi:MAG: universal stress protein [Solirubrobacteraceae bacterium]